MPSHNTNEKAYHGYQDWKGWDTLFTPSASECALFSQEFKLIRLAQKNTLDIGFGSGALLAWMQSEGANVAGIEIQRSLLEAAQNQGVTVFNDITEVSSDQFDVITLFDVLEHLSSKQIEALLLQAYRVARSGCTIIIRIPNCQSPAGLANQFADPTHISMLSGPLVGSLLKQANFHGVIVREAHLKPSTNRFNRILRRLALPLIYAFEFLYKLTWSIRLTPLSANVIVVATK